MDLIDIFYRLAAMLKEKTPTTRRKILEKPSLS